MRQVAKRLGQDLEVEQGNTKRPLQGDRTDRRAPLQGDLRQKRKIRDENEQELGGKALTSQFGEISRAAVHVMPALWHILQHIQEKQQSCPLLHG